MSDVIKFRCKACDKKIVVRAEYAGKKAKCPGCKQPLRVPSPRPKRSSTGVPVAGAVASSDPGASGAGAKSYSLADLAEMEANAEAEIKELSHKSRPNGARIPNGKDCPECGASCKPEAVLCVHCGHSFEGGKKLKTKKESKIGGAVRSVASGLNEKQDAGSDDFWKYAGPTLLFFILSIACYTGMVGMIGDSIPIEFVQDLKGTYDSMGAVGAGTFFLILCAISGGIWFFMKRILLR